METIAKYDNFLSPSLWKAPFDMEQFRTLRKYHDELSRFLLDNNDLDLTKTQKRKLWGEFFFIRKTIIRYQELWELLDESLIEN